MEPGPANRPPGGDDFRLAARSHTIATGTIVSRGKQMFLTDSWYVAANGLEVGRAPFARTILNQPIVLYRRQDGAPVAFEDSCCHRQLPLSMGEVVGDDLICGYHGLRYDESGRCIEVPGQPTPPPGAGVRAFPVVEKWGFIMLWMGDPALADEGLLPNWWWADEPGWKRANNNLIDIDCDYRLINDNLIDVTHVSFVHKQSIGNEAVVDFPQEMEIEDRFMRATRWIRDRPPPPMYQAAGRFTGNVDRGQIVEFTVPCYTANHAILNQVENGKPVDEGRVQHVALSAATPESETQSHYFFTFVRNYGLDDPYLDRVFDRQFVDVFYEDAAILDAQQMNMDRNPDAATINIAVDKGPMQARRLIDDQIAAEEAAKRPIAGAAE
jgi:phenylpropionate dioxygenase-like ring-hydroxylating dioxygenase large terminal subunit